MRLRLAIGTIVLLLGAAALVSRGVARAGPHHATLRAPTGTTSTTTSTTTTTTAAPVILEPGAAAAGEQAGPTGQADPAAGPTGEPASNGAPPCTKDQVTIVVSVNAATVAPGQTIDAVANESNNGDQPCQWPGDVRFTWRDANGAQFQIARSDVAPASVQWQPGQVLDQRDSWDQRFADGSTAAPGLAGLTVEWGPAGGPAITAFTQFMVAAPPPAG